MLVTVRSPVLSSKNELIVQAGICRPPVRRLSSISNMNSSETCILITTKFLSSMPLVGDIRHQDLMQITSVLFVAMEPKYQKLLNSVALSLFS